MQVSINVLVQRVQVTVQNVQYTLWIKKRGTIFSLVCVFFAFPRRCRVTDPVERNKTFYPPLDTMEKPRGGQWWPFPPIDSSWATPLI